MDTVNAIPNSQLIVTSGTAAYYLSGGQWVATRTGLTQGAKARFTTFLNQVFMVNGADATATWDGAAGSWLTTGNALSAPTAKFIETFRGRMWTFGSPTLPSRMYFSSVPSAVATPVITWNTDPATGQWIDISPQDGDFPTGLARFRNVMLAFKTNRIYRVFDIGQIDPDPFYAVGTSSQESIVETKVGLYFHHSSGIYQYNVYGIVQEVSRPVIDFIKAIPTSFYPNVVGWLDTQGDHVCWQIGTVTVRGTTYANCVLRYTISTQTWTHYSYPTQHAVSIRRQPFWTDGTTMFSITGDSSGNVMQMDTGTQDVGTTGAATPISYSLIHRWENVDGLLSTRKNLTIGNFCHVGGTGSSVAYQTEDADPDALNDWTKRVGALKQKNTGFPTMGIKGRKVRFRVFGQSTGQTFFYNGYELLNSTSEYLQFS